MNFDKFKKICLEHYEEIVNAFCESAASYNIVFPKNEIEYTYYFENNDNEYSFIITGETYYNDRSGSINLTIFPDIEKKSIHAKFDYNYDYLADEDQGYAPDFTIIKFLCKYDKTFENNECWNELIEEISSMTY